MAHNISAYLREARGGPSIDEKEITEEKFQEFLNILKKLWVFLMDQFISLNTIVNSWCWLLENACALFIHDLSWVLGSEEEFLETILWQQSSWSQYSWQALDSYHF